MRNLLGKLIRKILDKYNVLLYEYVLNDLERWNKEHIKELSKYLDDDIESVESVEYWKGMIDGHKHLGDKINMFKKRHLK